MAGRRFAFRQAWLKSFDVGIPVVVVGNLTVGGTGKTPLTVWLARLLIDRGYRVGIVCRGYGGQSVDRPRLVSDASTAAEVGDEARLLAQRTGCPVAVGADRVAAVAALLAAASLDIVLSDDGLAHYRLKRAFEFAVIDGTRGLGNGLCLPAGPLREPVSRLHQVDAVVINEGDYQRPGAFYAAVHPIRVVEIATGRLRALTDFADLSVHAIAAIGNPARFFDLLERHNITLERHVHADHAVLTARDLDFGDGQPVLMTEKDAVKCSEFGIENLWSVVIELKFVPGDRERLERMLMLTLERQPDNQ
jgi:tetraacyldisaccharide 4'-kinase